VRPGPAARAAFLVALAFLLGACSGGSSASEDQDSSGSYLIVAIDYHFHNAHPTVPLPPQRTLVVLNDSVHLHNVTIVGTTFSKDVQPGDRLTIQPLRSVLPNPGRYRFFCFYHRDRGMRGLIVVK
jgi:plastocyanin